MGHHILATRKKKTRQKATVENIEYEFHSLAWRHIKFRGRTGKGLGALPCRKLKLGTLPYWK